jgi:hypothetical protein
LIRIGRPFTSNSLPTISRERVSTISSVGGR